MITGEIIKVSGPLVVAKGMEKAKMYDIVYVSEQRLIGEIIELRGDNAYIQVYEDTGGIGVGEKVYSAEEPLCVTLGPGLIGSVYDGIQRPLDRIRLSAGDYVTRGIKLPPLSQDKKWHFIPSLKEGEIVSSGDIIGYVDETTLVKHKILVPEGFSGKIVQIYEGEYTISDTVAVLQTEKGYKYQITMAQKSPVRKSRPYKKKLAPITPLFTGQRIIDTLFPIGKGGTACVPGPFGSGKTIIQHQLAKWSDAEIIVYVGCGERGNEMCDVLLSFPELKDPKSGEPLIKRTVLVANTSNMPVAAREASIYTGITIAEYFRDMGYSVALMADSTSRWAEALREISGRLQEMPGEEGYPAYLPKRIAEFYERAGRVICLGKDEREGSLSVIGAVSPPGGDLSDAVVQATLKVVKVFWSLEDWLAHSRHFPAINWLTSYSEYHDELEQFYYTQLGEDWKAIRVETMKLLQKEAELKEVVRLVGLDALSAHDRLVMESAKCIREDYLYQNAFDPIDTFASGKKQYLMLKNIITFYTEAKEALERDKELHKIITLPIREEIARMRFIPEQDLSQIEALHTKLINQLRNI